LFVPDKVDFKPKLVRRDNEGHFIPIKGTIYQEEITTVNVYVPNVGVPNFIKYTLLYLKTHTPPKNDSGILQYSTVTIR
jgi:hypothetical protein